MARNEFRAGIVGNTWSYWLKWEPEHPDRLVGGRKVVWERWEPIKLKSQAFIPTRDLN